MKVIYNLLQRSLFLYSGFYRNIMFLGFLMVFYNKLSIGQNSPDADILKLKTKLVTEKGADKIKTLLSLSYQFGSLSSDSAYFYADQALKLSAHIKNDTLIGRSYLKLGHAYLLLGKDSSSFAAFSKAAEIFRKDNDSSNLANVLTAFGQYYYYKADYDKSFNAYYAALIIYSKLKDPKSYENVILVLDGISYIYYERKDYKNALEYMHRALKIADEIDDHGFTAAMLYSSMASIYYDWKQNDKALEYYKKAYEINRITRNRGMLAYSMNDIGRIYFETGHPDSAYIYYTRAAEIFIDINDAIGISASYQSIGDIYQKQKDYETALNFYRKSLTWCEKKDEKSRISSLLLEIGRTYYKMKAMDKALENSTRSLAIARRVHENQYVYENYKLLSDIYSAMDSCENAFFYYKKYVDKKDSIFTKDIHQQISDIQEKYETDKQDKQIKILKQKDEIQKSDLRRQKIVKYSFLVVAILLSVLAMVIFWNFRMKKKANIIIAAEKDKSDKLLINILPEETAEELKREGFARTRYYEHVSVLFTDFKGFTTIAEKMTPEQLVAELDHCFTAYDLIVEKHGIEKIKTIGDSYMCAGGLPVANTSNPVDIVNCGLDICNFMLDYKQKRMEKNEPFFEVRIGIHTGPVVSGIVGTKKFAYDIWGDTVNTAARMESSGIPGSVNISGDTYQFVKDHFTCTHRGKIEAKNKGLIDMYIVNCCKENSKVQ